MAETRRFPHHLIREIFEQPDALRRTIEPRVSLAEGRVRLDEVHISREELRALRRIKIVASGTSRHAGMTGQLGHGTASAFARCARGRAIPTYRPIACGVHSVKYEDSTSDDSHAREVPHLCHRRHR